MKVIPPRKGKVHFVKQGECGHTVMTRCGLLDKTGRRVSNGWEKVTCENCIKTEYTINLEMFPPPFWRGITNVFSGKPWTSPPNYHARYYDTPGWAESDAHNLPVICLRVGDGKWVRSDPALPEDPLAQDGYDDDELLCGLFASECYSYPDNPEDEYFDYTYDQSEVTCPSCKYILNKLD